MTSLPSSLAAAFEAVRRTNTAHASAIDALEQAFDAGKVILEEKQHSPPSCERAAFQTDQT
jgi:hypothetical protein